MKQTISILILAAMLYSFGNNAQNKALSDAKDVQSAIKQMQPGGIPTTEGGWTMKAKIDGKDWVANSIIPPDVADRISGDNNGESIGLPYDRRDMVVGQKIKFSVNNAVDLMTNDDVGIWGGRKGEMEITKVDNNWAEGKFFFTGSTSSSDKTIEVTDGFFRISMARKQ
jgi:hypothetical protein